MVFARSFTTASEPAADTGVPGRSRGEAASITRVAFSDSSRVRMAESVSPTETQSRAMSLPVPAATHGRGGSPCRRPDSCRARPCRRRRRRRRASVPASTACAASRRRTRSIAHVVTGRDQRVDNSRADLAVVAERRVGVDGHGDPQCEAQLIPRLWCAAAPGADSPAGARWTSAPWAVGSNHDNDQAGTRRPTPEERRQALHRSGDRYYGHHLLHPTVAIVITHAATTSPQQAEAHRRDVRTPPACWCRSAARRPLRGEVAAGDSVEVGASRCASSARVCRDPFLDPRY